jgi:hypothetical protein
VVLLPGLFFDEKTGNAAPPCDAGKHDASGKEWRAPLNMGELNGLGY